MAIKTNPWLEELEKKHPKVLFAICFIVALMVLLIGIFWLIVGVNDIAVPILMIILGALGVICTIFLKRTSRK